MSEIYKLLDDLELDLACEDDRGVSEFRDRNPEQVKAIDVLRRIVDYLESSEYLKYDVKPDDLKQIIEEGLQ